LGSGCIERFMETILQIFIGASLLIVAIAFAIHLTITKPIKDAAVAAVNAPVKIVGTAADLGKYAIEKAADAFMAIFQSKVSIHSSSVVCDATPIAELAILKRNIREFIDYSNTNLGSTKRIIAEQTFAAKIGFDLAARFSASFDSIDRIIKITLPEPKVLSLESAAPESKYYLEADGIINWTKTEDHHQVLIRLKDQARKSADSALAISDARLMIETRFRDLFSRLVSGLKY